MDADLPQMGPRRLLMTADPIGGVWTFALELIRALDAPDLEVALVVRGREPSREQLAEAMTATGGNLYVLPQKLEWMDNPWDDLRAAQEALAEIVADFRPDLLHANDFGSALAPVEVPVVLSAHSCVYSWWAAVKHSRPPAHWEPYRRLVQAALARAEVVVAPTRAMADALGEYGVEIPHLRVIPNGRAPAAFVSQPHRQPRIAAAGRFWDEAKNFTMLEAIAPDLPWPICVAGESPANAPEVRGLRLLGRLEARNMRQLLASSAIFAHPARYEPFGLAPLEAALAECALVLADLPSLREVWGDAALFVPADAPDAWRDTLLALIERPSQRLQWGRRALARARQFSAEAMAQAYRGLYAQHLGPAQPPPPPAALSLALPSFTLPPFA